MSDVPIFLENAFHGLDATTPADLMEPGFLPVCDDAVFVGHIGMGGALQTRPGFRAKWTSALSKAYIGPGAVYRKNDGTQLYIFCAGSSATDATGTLYYWTKGATSPTAISSGGVVFTVGNVQMARFDNYVFIVGATDGKVYRYAPETGVFEGIIGATTPTYTVAAALTNKTILAFSSTGSSNFQSDVYPTSGVSVTNPLFVNGSTSGISPGSVLDAPTNAWLVGSGSTTAVECATGIDPANPSRKFVRLDAVGDVVETNAGAEYLNLVKTVPDLGTGSSEAGGPRYCLHFTLAFDLSTTAISQGVRAQVVLCDNAGVEKTFSEIATARDNTGLRTVVQRHTFGSVISDTVPIKAKLRFIGDTGNTGGTVGPYVSNILLVAIRLPAPSTNAPNLRVPLQNTPTTFAALGQMKMTYNAASENGGAAWDFTNRTQVVLKYIPAIAGLDTPQLTLQLRNGTTLANAVAAIPQISPQLSLFTDTDGTKYLIADISTLTRNQVWVLDLVFAADITLPSGVTPSGQTLMTIGPFVDAGNLSVGYSPYTYAIRERLATTNYLSQAVYASPGLNPTQILATGKLTWSVNPPTNASATTEVWRAGGIFDDGLYRKIAEISSGGTNTYNTTYITYSSGTLTDTTPDSWLIGSTGMIDHTAPQFGTSGAWGSAVAVAVFAQRLAIGTQTTSTVGVTPGIFLSQITYGAENGLYWDVVNDKLSPNIETQGWFQRVSGNENASSGTAIVRLVVYGQTLVLLFKDMLAHLFGSSPVDFTLTKYEGTTQRGPITAQAVTVFNNLVYFLAEDGLRTWNGADINKVSSLIDAALNPQAALTGPPLNATAYALSSLFSHAERLCLAAPFTASDTDTAGIYVLDTLAGGKWLRWNKTKITGGFVFASAADQNDLYVTDGNGMLYQLSGGTYGDTATAAGSVSAVTLSVATRWFTSQTRKLRAERMAFTAYSNDSTPVYTLTVIGAGDTAQQYQLPFTGVAGETAQGRLKVSSRVRGRYLQMTFTAAPGTATNFAVLRRLELIATPDRMI